MATHQKVLALVVACAVLLISCASPTSTIGSQETPTPQPTPSADPETERAVAIYAAAIKELVLRGNTFREGRNPFDILYVLDQAYTRAANVVRRGREGEPIPTEVQEGIKEALSELGPIEFISDRDSVIGPPQQGSLVKNHGSLITLGTIPTKKKRVELSMNMYVANLAGTWLTYVVKHRRGRWTVTGTTGPIAIS